MFAHVDPLVRVPVPSDHPPTPARRARVRPPTHPSDHPPPFRHTESTPDDHERFQNRHFERQLRGNPPRKQQNTHAVVLVSQLYGLIRSHRPIDANGWIGLWNRFSKKRRSQAELYLARAAREENFDRFAAGVRPPTAGVRPPCPGGGCPTTHPPRSTGAYWYQRVHVGKHTQAWEGWPSAQRHRRMQSSSSPVQLVT